MSHPPEISNPVPSPLKIAVIPGDGTGPEVAAEGLKVWRPSPSWKNFSTNSTHFDFGGERYLRTGETLPAGAVDELRKFDAIYLGAVGHPDVPPGILEKGLLLELRFQLDQYINLRPVKLFPGVETPLQRQRARTTSTLSSSARTPKTCTAASAAS